MNVLCLNETAVRDVTPLAGLSGRVDLYLGGAQLHDASRLANLKSLTWLQLDNTAVPRIAIDELQLAMPQCVSGIAQTDTAC